MFARRLCLPFVLVAAAVGFADGPADNIPEKVRPVPPVGIEIPAADADEIKAGLAELQGLIKGIGKHELLPDVEIHEKAVRYAITYREVFDALDLEASDEPVIGDLYDDLADIYSDLAEGLFIYRHVSPTEAERYWRQSFRYHWGEHATGALRAFYCAFQHEPNDA